MSICICHMLNAFCTVLCSAITAVIFTMGGFRRNETFRAVILYALETEGVFLVSPPPLSGFPYDKASQHLCNKKIMRIFTVSLWKIQRKMPHLKWCFSIAMELTFLLNNSTDKLSRNLINGLLWAFVIPRR